MIADSFVVHAIECIRVHQHFRSLSVANQIAAGQVPQAGNGFG
jgi:hypothetical protein